MILEIERLSVSFGDKRVLEDVSFGVERGEAVAIMGPNGAGKTTVLRCILGLVRYGGRITVDGLDARRRGVEARSRIGYVPQSPAFYRMTAREVLRFVARLRRTPSAEADRALARLGLEAEGDRRVEVFSGGMLQRLSLAAALLGDPPIVLLDEPTANLDAPARADLLSLLREFRAAGKTLVLSSHRAREVRELADRAIVLGHGRVMAAGRPREVLPADRVALRVEAHGDGEKARVAAFLPAGAEVVPTRNGALEATLPADAAVAAVERLRAGGVEAGRIALRAIEDGGGR
jgi:ABC-type multidrug transport system ATPase subunit